MSFGRGAQPSQKKMSSKKKGRGLTFDMWRVVVKQIAIIITSATMFRLPFMQAKEWADHDE